jgi:hypothetical protein
VVLGVRGLQHDEWTKLNPNSSNSMLCIFDMSSQRKDESSIAVSLSAWAVCFQYDICLYFT